MAWAVNVSTEEELRAQVASDATAQTITLTQNIALTSTLVINRSVVLDLNGYNISADGFRAIWIKIGENVEIQSEKPAAITVTGAIADNSSVIRIGDNENSERNLGLIIGENVTVYTEKCYGITVFGNKTKETLVINGKVITTNVTAISGNGTAGYGNTTITIGKTAEITTSNEVAIYHPQSGTLTINGTVTGAGGIEMKGGDLVVGPEAHIKATAEPSHAPNNDGTSTRGYAIAIVESNGGYVGVHTVNIDADAEIVGPVAMLVDSEHSGVTPPDFSGSEVQMNVSVTSGTDVKQYVSLNDALKVAPAGATVQLLNDVTLTETAIINKDNVKIDLNGKNITASGCRALWAKNEGAQITNSDTSDPARGTISATGIVNPDWSVIQVGEAESATAAGLTIDKNVTITTNDCYGITTAGTGESSLTVNGKVTTKVRPAVYSTNNFTTTIGADAVITTTDEVAVYATGAVLSVSGAVTGLSAVETKSGTLHINNAKLTATALPSHTPNNSGTSSRGYAVAMVKNDNFNDITSVTFSGTNTITGPVATLIDSGSDADPSFSGITMLADINGEHYSSVIDATNIVPADGTVKLMQDLALNEPLTLDRHASYKIDLDGHYITATNSGAIDLKSGDVIITNTGDAATISSTGSVASSAAVIHLGDNTGENRNISLGIDNNITVSTGVCQGVLLSGTNTRESLTVKGTVSTTGQPAISGDKANGGTTINIEEDAKVTSTGNVAIYHPQTGTLTVEGIAGHNAVVSGTTGIEMKAGDLIVGEHATITATATSATHTASDVAPSTSGYGIAIIENANFDGVGNVDIETTQYIYAPVTVAMLVDSKHAGIAEPEFIGNVMIVAEVSGTTTDKYAKLEDAFTVAQAGNTVRLLEDAAIANTLTVDKAITIDLNDYTITGTQTSGYVITTRADITIKDGGIVANNGGGISCTAGALTMEKLNVRAKENSLNIASTTTATATIDANSTLTSTTGQTIELGDNTTLTVSGKIYNTTTNAIAHSAGSAILNVNSGATISTASGYAINWRNDGTLTVEGGQLHGTTAAVYANKGTVTVEGGTFTGTTDALVIENANASDCIPSVKHGTFNSGTGDPIKSSGTNAAVGFVEGDYFSKAIAQTLCATGYRISTTTNSNGMHYLVSELVITDATIWTGPANSDEEYTIHTAKYIRNTGMGTTHFGTLCLPFSFTPGATGTTIPEGMKFYSVNRIEDDILYLDVLSGEISAGTPVIFHRTGTETSFTIESEEANIPFVDAKSEYNLVGTFKTTEITEGLRTKYFLNDDHFHQAMEKITVPAFRAYIDNPTVSPARVLTISIEDELDDIDAIFQEDAEEMIFDLQGTRQEELKPGFNLVKKNGRTIKVYVNK